MDMKAAQLALMLGISVRRLNQMAHEGKAVRVAPGTYDAAATIQNMLAAASGKAAGAAVTLDLDKERARLAAEQADGHALKNATTRAEMVRAADVVREWQGIIGTVRSAMLAVPSRCRRRASTFGTAEIEIIDREIRDALEAISNDESDAPPGAESGEASAENEAVQVD
ncbi:terminase small subunit [Hoeflea sp. G2-23]|uniref:Terminase small subunit n=1 Tax=Hoeflea algicola TaxID=2983763 RepID=A0ABT3ZDN7_9HYPH|nr:terminase small subunit [Hoeflea algicola]MCY0149849.1 terminase small subunit [Hoeflea algicola]